MRNDRDIDNETNQMGVALRLEQNRIAWEKEKEAQKTELDRYREEACALVEGLAVKKDLQSSAAPKSRTRAQIAAAQEAAESGKIYYKLDPTTGALVPIKK